jgi:hypothetical protein
MKELKELLLQAPDGHIDKSALSTIQEWDDQPKAIQVLKTLDICVHAGLASGFAIHVLETIMNQCLQLEGKTYEQILPEAVWRN